MSTYSQLLKDPRWQKKRLEIMNRDDWSCQECCDTSEMLVVHHKYYDKKLMPWEYPEKCYMTLCNSCHEQYHKDEKDISNSIIDNFKRSDLSLTTAWALSSIFKNLNIECPDERFITALRYFLEDPCNQQFLIDNYESAPMIDKLRISEVTQNG